MGKLQKLANKAGRTAQAFAEWLFLLPRTRKSLSRRGVVNARDYVDVRMGLRLDTNENVIEWIDSFGIGLVKEPSDIYTYMLARLGELPEFSFTPLPSGGIEPKVSGIGFMTRGLPSGARFYYCPFARDTFQASVWIYQTANVMGYHFWFPTDF